MYLGVPAILSTSQTADLQIHPRTRPRTPINCAQFSGGEVDFSSAQFSGGMVDFLGAQFSGGTVRFSLARFSGGTVRFRAARFSGSTVDFSGVDVWSHPPRFAWEGMPPAGIKLPVGIDGVC